MKSTVSLSIPTFNRSDLILECVQHVRRDQRLKEICISDDCSTDGSYRKIIDRLTNIGCSPHTVIHQNERNLDCYFNKFQAVKKSTSDWCILFDDDNIIPKKYLDLIFALPEWDPETIYCPEFAEPHFDYTAFAGITVTERNVAKLMGEKHFSTMLNTCNYFVNRNAYIEVWDGSIDPHTADSIFMAYNWLRFGGKIHVVPGLRYFHRVHKGSHFKRENHKTGKFAQQIEQKLRELK